MEAINDQLTNANQPRSHRGQIAYNVALGVALALFVIMASRHIKFPGPYYDECLGVNTGVYLAKPHVNSGYPQSWGVKIAGFDFPVMSNEYIGAVKSYVMALSFSIFGVSIPVMRLTMVFVALLGVLFAALFSKEAFGPLASAYGVLLVDLQSDSRMDHFSNDQDARSEGDDRQFTGNGSGTNRDALGPNRRSHRGPLDVWGRD